MRSGSLSMSTRRALFGIAVAALLCGASGLRAQDAAAAPPAEDALKFNTESAVVIWQINQANAADFESAWTAIKSKLSMSDKPDFKELGDSITIFKAMGTPAGQPAVYVMEISPASKTLSYDPAKILYAPDMWPREEADALFKKISDGLANLSALPLQKLGGSSMGMGMGGM